MFVYCGFCFHFTSSFLFAILHEVSSFKAASDFHIYTSLALYLSLDFSLRDGLKS